MQSIKILLSNKPLSLGLGAVLILGVATANTLNTTSVLANTGTDETQKCFDFYGREIVCPVANKRFHIEKLVKLSTEDDSQYRHEVKGVLNDQTLNFKITVTNTGEVSVDDLKLIDFLPSNLDNLQLDEKLRREGQTLRFALGRDFEPGEREVFLFSAQANVEGMEPGSEKCVVNKAAIYRDRNNNDTLDDGETENADVATVCIKRGQVLGKQPQKLPETSAGGLSLILGSLSALSLGMVLTKRVSFGG